MKSIFESILRNLNETTLGIKYPDIKSFKFLQNTKYIYKTIEESLDIFKSSSFRNVLSLFTDSQSDSNVFRGYDILSKIDIDNILNKVKKDKLNEAVFVFKFNFKIFSKLLKCMSVISNEDKKNLQDDTYINDLYYKLFKSSGAFVSGESNGVKFSIIFLNENSIDLDLIKHEMIHYLQYVADMGFVKNEKYLKINLENDTFGLIDKEDLLDIFNGKELIPYIHNICYVLEKHGINSVDDALSFIDKFKNERKLEINQYIEKCKSFEEYSWFDNKKSINMLMLSIIYKRNLKIFEITIAKYFSKD